MIPINYYDKFSPKNNNIVVFISKINELNNISFPKNLNFDLKNKTFRDNLYAKNEVDLIFFNESQGKVRLIFKLIDSKLENFLLFGSNVCDKFNFANDQNITFLFSKNLISNKKPIIPDIILGFNLKIYYFDKYLTKKKKLPKKLFVNKLNKKNHSRIQYNANLLFSINFTKDLVSEPANFLNPKSYSEICLKLNIKGLKIKVLDLSQINKIGMKALLGVAKGSVNEPRVIIFEWNIKKNIKPTVLIGKGVTFDSGGLSLKPANGMEEMITDMGGSAVVAGSMINAALNKSRSSLVGIIGLVENMPDGESQRPGDIIKSLSGKTIEVINTDAEGRLVLADLITYIQKKYNPSKLIDFATLTGAVMIALGTHKAGLFSNNEALAKKIQIAGKNSNENVWRLPLGDEYDVEINSSRADIRNIGFTRFGGSTQAAQFIYRFVENNIPWAHLDIAGVSWTMKGGQSNTTKLHNPGATAFGVRLIDEFLKG